MDSFITLDAEFVTEPITLLECSSSLDDVIPIPVNFDDRLPGVGGYCVVA